MAPRNIVLIVR